MGNVLEKKTIYDFSCKFYVFSLYIHAFYIKTGTIKLYEVIYKKLFRYGIITAYIFSMVAYLFFLNLLYSTRMLLLFGQS